MSNPSLDPQPRPETTDGVYSEIERGLANRNHGVILETLAMDVTPTGAHYLLTHFDVPLLDAGAHRLKFHGAFSNPFDIGMDDIKALPQVTMPVTLECGGNGRARMPGRNHSMPWANEAVGTSEWTGTPLKPLIEQAGPTGGVEDFVFTGADFGFDDGIPHAYGRSLTPDEFDALDVLLVHEMNGQPLMPQHGAPLRIVVPGWFGMASVKWLTDIEAITSRYQGFQQVQTYRMRQVPDEPGDPLNEIVVKSLMVPPGVPDWTSRRRFMHPGEVTILGRAWSGGGRKITKVEFGVGDDWTEATLHRRKGEYAWTKWTCDWDAPIGEHVLRCRATDEAGNVQPIQAPWNLSGFAINSVQEVDVTVSDRFTEVPG